jgi:hypothetical protein
MASGIRASAVILKFAPQFDPLVALVKGAHFKIKCSISAMTNSHGRAGYRRGCRCATCKSAEAQRKREARMRGPRIASVTAMPQAVSAIREPGEVEHAVRVQCENSAKSADMPGIVAAAIACARQIDDPNFAGRIPQLVAKLHMLLNSLQGQRRKVRPGRLAIVQSMTNRKRVADAQ